MRMRVLGKETSVPGVSSFDSLKGARSTDPFSVEEIRSALRGGTQLLETLPQLPESKSEVEQIARRFRSTTVLTEERATKAEVRRLVQNGTISQFRVIHWATHAFVDAEHPELSALVLSGTPRSDSTTPQDAEERLLRAGEIQVEWKLNADLVTLSACETALGRMLNPIHDGYRASPLQVASEGYWGLSQAFLIAGASSVLASLWKVDDHATSLFMSRFYEEWIGPGNGGQFATRKTKSQALRDTRRWLRSYRGERAEEIYAHPYYWAAFVLIGDAE
jgi:CHAT domain-containing protein